MATRQVTGVVWWEMRVSHYQGLYRRARSGEPPGGYTRDFLQGPRPISSAFRLMFHGSEPPYEPLTYRWPGGAFTGGRIYKAADYDEIRRVDVGQWTGTGPPAPWRIGDSSVDPAITLEGSLDLAIPEDATAQWNDQLAPQQPILVMVQLEWSQSELHLRAYLGKPPEHLADASVTRVPEMLRVHMTGRNGLVLGHGLPDLWFDEEDLRDPWRTNPRSTMASPVTPSPEAAVLPAPVGVPYRPADEESSSAASDPFEVDPDSRDRGTRMHATTQNALAAVVQERGCAALSPATGPSFDLAWEEPGGTLVVAEVKSVTPANSEKQLRLALGQVLRYRHLLAASHPEVRAIIALSGAPQDPDWEELCASLDIGLIWKPDLGPMLTEWLST